jgi:signal transduction histidine kinase
MTSTRTAQPGRLRPVAQFVALGLVLAVLLALTAAWLSRRAALDEAVRDARVTTQLLGSSVVAPALGDAVLAGGAAAVDRLDRQIRSRVLVGDVLRVKLWDADGTIVYSDETRLIGQQYALGADEREILEQGGVEAEASDLGKPENVYERPLGRLLEVYTPVTTPSGEPLLFEAYYSFDQVSERSNSVLASFGPIAAGGILLFLALSVPLVWLLARRLADSSAERERLLLAAVRASDTERRRIARDLHDGVVQELVGTTYSLAATSRQVGGTPMAPDDRDRLVTALDDAAGGLRRNLRSLRSLLVEIYPPDLRTNGLAAAVDDLVGPLAANGVDADVQMGDTADLPGPVVELMWRVTQEAVRNAVRHGRPAHIAVQVRRPPGGAVLEVHDDGGGFDQQATVGDDHFGLRGLRDLAAEHGAELVVTSSPGQGTIVRLEVPSP